MAGAKKRSCCAFHAKIVTCCRHTSLAAKRRPRYKHSTPRIIRLYNGGTLSSFQKRNMCWSLDCINKKKHVWLSFVCWLARDPIRMELSLWRLILSKKKEEFASQILSEQWSQSVRITSWPVLYFAYCSAALPRPLVCYLDWVWVPMSIGCFQCWWSPNGLWIGWCFWPHDEAQEKVQRAAKFWVKTSFGKVQMTRCAIKTRFPLGIAQEGERPERNLTSFWSVPPATTYTR